MNFFGHATVALWSQHEPAFLFGAMLPDFTGMVGVRMHGASTHPTLQAGIDLHHRTDDAFHGAPLFVEQCRQAVQELENANVQRASARAVAHVGTELLLDGFLAHDDAAVAAYRTAMHEAHGLIDAIEFRSEDGAERCRWLTSRLNGAPIPHRYADPDFVTERLVFALAPRPRLALSAHDTNEVRRWIARVQPQVNAFAPSLMAYVRGQLGTR